jgi:hypothetical protein
MSFYLPPTPQGQFARLCSKGELKPLHDFLSQHPYHAFNYEQGFWCACTSGNIELIQMFIKKCNFTDFKTRYRIKKQEGNNSWDETSRQYDCLSQAIRCACDRKQFHVLEKLIQVTDEFCFHDCSLEGIQYLLNHRHYRTLKKYHHSSVLNKQRWRRIACVTLVLKNKIWTSQNFPLMDLNIIRFILVPYIEY